jgi:DNA-binding NarL/FixJ family response regulator
VTPANANVNAAQGEAALPYVWQQFAAGGVQVADERIAGTHVELTLALRMHPEPLTPFEATTLVRVLSGESQKAIAAQVALGPSTISSHVVRGLDKLGLRARFVPLPVVLAALSRCGVAEMRSALQATLAADGAPLLLLTVPRPSMTRVNMLTRAEQEVAQLLIEGRPRWSIARARSTTPCTVARQCHEIYRTFGITGRYALVRRAAELGCFQ